MIAVPSAKKACGDCTLCCKVMAIEELAKLVTPDREFDLGLVRSDERIVREIEGTRVVNVTVVKASDLEA
jgi:hypothetical protein